MYRIFISKKDVVHKYSTEIQFLLLWISSSRLILHPQKFQALIIYILNQRCQTYGPWRWALPPTEPPVGWTTHLYKLDSAHVLSLLELLFQYGPGTQGWQITLLASPTNLLPKSINQDFYSPLPTKKKKKNQQQGKGGRGVATALTP